MSELSNYKYIRTIGEGTFGKVKLAIHILTGEKVAIKILQKNLIKGQKQYERIHNEIKYLKLLNHPNIIKIFEVIENDFSFFIVMEYATGGELFNYIVLKEKLSERETSFFFFQIIQGVRKIHEKKICHRDIKPENLLLSRKNVIKIIDFGLSSEYDEVLETPCGSPCYASPEMIKGQKYKGLSVDLWACGVILFAMLFGYLPFDDNDNNILFKKILDCEIDFPEEKEIDVGKDAIDLINKILNPDPEKRIGIDEVEKHPFMEYGKKEYEKLFKKENFRQEELIINYMENELGFDNRNNDIQNDISSNRHNHVTTTYYLLKQKCLEGRLVFSFRERLYKKITKRKNLEENKSNNYNSNSDYLEENKKNENTNTKNINHYQIIKTNNFSKNNNSIHKRNKTTSRSESKKNLDSLKEILTQKDFADNRNNIIIINNTNMIHEPEKIKSIYNNIILKKNSIKNINQKIETSVSQEKRGEKLRNSTNIKSANTYRSNKTKKEIKVCLKKIDKKGNKLIYFKKISNDEYSKGKNNFNKLPLNNFSFKTQRRNNNILSYKKYSAGYQTVRKYVNNIHSFEGNNSNNLNFNSSISNQNINAFGSYDMSDIRKSNYNVNTNEEKNQKNIIKKKLMNNNIFENLQKNKLLQKTERIKLDLSKKNDLKEKISNLEPKSPINKQKENYSRNIEKIFKIIFPQNKIRNIHYINNEKKTSYDNKTKNKEHKMNEVVINLNNLNNSNNEIPNSNTSRNNKVIKSINTFNINNLTNKIIDKNILNKKINCYFIPSNKNHITKNNTNIINSKAKKSKKILSFKNLSPDYINNITYENVNLNTFNKINKTNKINNNNIKKLLSSNDKIKKNKIKIKHETNIYNILNTEKELSKNKINYIPITSRDRRTNHSRNDNFENNHNKFESNTVFLDLTPNINNKLLSAKKAQKKEIKEIPNQRHSAYSKQLISKLKKKNADKFLVANTEMTLFQITNKISSFCKENNLNYKKEGIYNIKIYNNNFNNFFNVEIVHSTPMNIVKIIRGKNNGNNMKEFITKLFIDIINFE